MEQLTIILIILGSMALIYYFYREWKKERDRKANLTWPREFARCPDYWLDKGDHVCQNTFNLGKCPRGRGGVRPMGTVDMKSIAGGIGGTGKSLDIAMNKPEALQQKCKWVKRCGTSWEGVEKLCA